MIKVNCQGQGHMSKEVSIKFQIRHLIKGCNKVENYIRDDNMASTKGPPYISWLL